jgi:hypothetical protein
MSEGFQRCYVVRRNSYQLFFFMVISFRGQGTCLHTVHEKIPARNWIHAHAQDFVMSDELLLAIPKAFVPLVNKQQARCIRHL